jgi:hypothetical protein
MSDNTKAINDALDVFNSEWGFRGKDVSESFSAALKFYDKVKWKPIDIAPMDMWIAGCGIGWSRSFNVYGTKTSDGEVEWCYESGHSTVTSHRHHPPTHWQLLPEPLKKI